MHSGMAGEDHADNMTVTPVRISYGHRMAIYCTLDTVSGSSLLNICPMRQTNLSDCMSAQCAGGDIQVSA